MNRLPTQFCPRGHDKDVVGRNKDGSCKLCKSNRSKKRYNENIEDERLRSKKYALDHKEEIKTRQQKWQEDNKAIIKLKKKKYRLTHKEKLIIYNLKYIKEHHKEYYDYQKQYRKEHPEIYRLNALMQQTKRRLRVVKWDQEGIVEFYKNCPVGYEVDHIIPLLGRKISGLHILSNLQYLIHEENSKKGNKWDGTLENNSWRK